MRIAFAAVAGVVLAAGTSPAQDGPFQFKPIDTNKYLVRPTAEATGFLSGATQVVSQMTATSIEKNGFVRTINNLFGTRQRADPIQSNGLPLPSAYPSTQYQNSFVPRMPTTQQFQR